METYPDRYQIDFKLKSRSGDKWENVTPIGSIAPIAGHAAANTQQDEAGAAYFALALACAYGCEVRWNWHGATQGHYVKPNATFPALPKTDLWHSVANPDDRDFWDHCYIVHLTNIGGGILVYASDESDALDEAADYVVAQGWAGYWHDEESVAEHEKEGWMDDLTSLGNDGHYFSSDELHIEQVY
jgi:hypothetical protein